MNALSLLRDHGYSELACQFAAYIGRQQQQEQPLVTLTAGLLSEAVAEGHVCLNLKAERVFAADINAVLPETQRWADELNSSDVVGEPGQFKPLILASDGLLYLYRYWRDERQVARAIGQRLHTVEPLPKPGRLQAFFNAWDNAASGVDWQKVAVLAALQRQLCVISGGPGTGKTTVVLKMLQALETVDPALRIALAAPTGKAAARLQQAVQHSGQPREAKTLHRLLGISPRYEQGRYSVERPLPVDVLIIDEASMIDVSLMALTLSVLPLHARLILLGDSEQLASVESGAVLASLCAGEPVYSEPFRQWAKQAAGIDVPAAAADNPLPDSMVKLRHSYRFAAGGHIGQLADAVKHGDAMRVIDILHSGGQPRLFAPTSAQLQTQLLEGYRDFIAAVEGRQDAASCLQAFERFRLLCALKQGPQSVAAANSLMQDVLARRGWRTRQPFYVGRPLMITQNQYRLNLFNGDIGLVLPSASGELQACFNSNGELRWLPLSRLPAHDTVFAMTVHKSQGSEFDRICLLLPQEESPLLNRELVYTAMTRARDSLTVLAAEVTLQRAIQRRHQRESGLDALLKTTARQLPQRDQ